jgi:hypothetical protein
MTRPPTHSSPKKAAPKAKTLRRKAPSGLKLLTAFRCLDVGKESHSGFVRALRLSESDTLLEMPEPFATGQNLSLEFLLDNNRIARVEGQVTRVSSRAKFYHVAVEFRKIPPQARRLIALQLAR